MKQDIVELHASQLRVPDTTPLAGGTHHSFAGFTESLKRNSKRRALTIRPFIKIERLSYAELYVRAQQAAYFLRSKGITSGDRVMVVAANSPQWVVLFLGCQLLGAALVPVDARNNYQTVSTFIEQTKPSLIFVGDHLMPELSSGHNAIILDSFLSLIAGQPTKRFPSKVSGNETSVIVFTSGTTAAPKGVVLTQKNILANVYAAKKALSVSRDWRFMSVLPLSHMYELTGGCLVALASGASIYYLNRVTPNAIAKGLKDYKITIMLAVPQLLILFLTKIRKSAKEEGQLATFEKALKITPFLLTPLRRIIFGKVHKELGGHLQVIITGGAPIPLEVDKAWEAMGVTTIQGYGLTETAPVLTMNGLRLRYFESQGHVLHNVQLRIAHDESSDAKAGVGGEIQVKGPSIFQEYYKNPKATREAFTTDGWFRTGDVGRLDKGWLRIQGRAKFAIVRSSGLKVFPEDVEVVADRDKLFTEVCVVGLKQADGEVVHAAVITTASDAQIEKSISAINQKLESFQHIDGWSRYPDEAFPRTRLLKVDRKTVQAWANDEAGHAAGAAGAGTAGGDTLSVIIRQTLDKPGLKLKDSDILSDLGLDSLRRLSVVSLIEDEMNVSVAEANITQRTTVGGLRKLIASGTAAPKSPARKEWTYHPFVRLIGNGVRNHILTSVANHYVHTTLTGEEHIARLKTPAIFIFNHVDGMDGPVLYKSLPKHIRNNLAVAVADDLMHDPKWATTMFQARVCFAAFNFARVEPFTPSLEYVGTLVDRGYNIALAPEGHISRSGQLEAFKSGIGLLAVELGIPVVPIKTTGLHGVAPLTKRWPQRHAAITVKIGVPITFTRGTDYIDATRQLHDIMSSM